MDECNNTLPNRSSSCEVHDDLAGCGEKAEVAGWGEGLPMPCLQVEKRKVLRFLSPRKACFPEFFQAADVPALVRCHFVDTEPRRLRLSVTSKTKIPKVKLWSCRSSSVTAHMVMCPLTVKESNSAKSTSGVV